jgi:predicted dehydrogenase
MSFSAPGDPRFKEVEETINFQLRFPSGLLANCTSTYGYASQCRLCAMATEGSFELLPDMYYTGLRMFVHRGNKVEEVILPQRDHFALEMDHMSDCVMKDKTPLTPGEEGLRDIKLIQAIYEAAKTGKTVKV